MARKRLIDWPYFLGLLSIPVVIVGILFVVYFVQGRTRFDPAYFTGDYLALYETPGGVARALEPALRNGDEELMHELLGTKRGPGVMESRESLIFALLYDVDDKYFHYLYFDASDYTRHIQYVKEQGERYIASRPDLYFYMDSGQWQRVAGPIAMTWWVLVIVFTLGVYFYRAMARVREKRYRGEL
jgi:hypothetical protein